jgi:hypothetical protein
MALSDSQPAAALSCGVRRCDLRPAAGLPQLLEPPSPHAVLTTPVDRIRGRRFNLPARPGLPQTNGGSASTKIAFRGLLKLHSRYGLRSCSPTIRGLCHEAPARWFPSQTARQLLRHYRHLLRGDLPPLVIRATGAHVRSAKIRFLPLAPCGPHGVVGSGIESEIHRYQRSTGRTIRQCGCDAGC